MTSSTVALSVFPDPETASAALAAEIAELIRSRPPGQPPVVLGLATGATPVLLYAELVRLHRDEGLSFTNVVTFNLDEYLGLERDHPQSYRTFMHQHFFDHVDLPASNIHLLDAQTPPDQFEKACTAYENAIRNAGGIDLQILGIGINGHIGFNEPGSLSDTRTRVVDLKESTTRRATGAFGGAANVPARAITIGVGTILDAKRIVLLAFGINKGMIIHRAITDPITEDLPATYLQNHPNVTFFLDEPAASKHRERI